MTGLEPQKEKEPVNVMQVENILQFMKSCAERLVQKSEQYIKTNDAEIQMDCIDIVTVKLNDFTQVFKDLVIFMRQEEGTYKTGNSLRYCMTSFDTFGFQQTEEEKVFLRELLLRNEITYDYFNRELHQQKLIWIMVNCSQGALAVYNDINGYCLEHRPILNHNIKPVENGVDDYNILPSPIQLFENISLIPG